MKWGRNNCTLWKLDRRCWHDYNHNEAWTISNYNLNFPEFFQCTWFTSKLFGVLLASNFIVSVKSFNPQRTMLNAARMPNNTESKVIFSGNRIVYIFLVFGPIVHTWLLQQEMIFYCDGITHLNSFQKNGFGNSIILLKNLR